MPEGVYSSSANTDLDYLNLSTLLQNEHIQPCTRARFSKSLTDAGGLASLIAAGKGTTTSVEGGNSRLVERLIRLSYADVRLNSSVIAINPGKSCKPLADQVHINPAPCCASVDVLILLTLSATETQVRQDVTKSIL